MQSNAMTPNVVFNQANQLASQRVAYLEQVARTGTGLDALNIKIRTLQPGEAEIAFLLPRELFNNRLDGLVKELSDLNLILGLFSEAATGASEPVEVHQISTSDPNFFFGMNPVTIACIGGAVTWALNTLKQILEIRKMYQDAKRLELGSDIEKLINDKINEKVNAAVEQKVHEIVANIKAGPRKHELENGLTWGLKSILAHVERGMTVEVRLVPPATALAPAEEGDGKDEERRAAFDQLSAISKELSFPPPLESPILELPVPETPSPPPPPTSRGRKGRDVDV
jgi:hypothetical protein